MYQPKEPPESSKAVTFSYNPAIFDIRYAMVEDPRQMGVHIRGMHGWFGLLSDLQRGICG